MKHIWKIATLAPLNFFLYPFYALASWVGTLSTWVLSPILSLWSVIAGIDVLPYPFSLFHTHDNTLDGGQKQGYRIGAKGIELWWQRVRWLCRNPCYGFNAYVLGFKEEGAKEIWSESIGNRQFDKGGSVIYVVIMEAANGRRYWSYRRDYPVAGKYYFKQWLGWHYASKDGLSRQLKSLPISIKTAD